MSMTPEPTTCAWVSERIEALVAHRQLGAEGAVTAAQLGNSRPSHEDCEDCNSNNPANHLSS